jgi:hypothetical protein
LLPINRGTTRFSQHRLHGVVSVGPFLNPLHVAQLNFMPFRYALADEFDFEAHIRGQHKP